MDDEIVFQQLLSIELLNIDNNKIWRVFKNIFGMKEQQIKDLISDMVEKYLKIKDYSIDAAVFK